LATTTVLLPTYKRPKLLRRAAQSVLQQTRGDFILRILDNAPSKETMEMVERLLQMDSRVEYVAHEKNIGSIENFIFGIKTVQTPYFCILCDDDLLLPDFLEKALDKHFSSGIHPVFVSMGVWESTPDGKLSINTSQDKTIEIKSPDEGAKKCLIFGVSFPGILFRTEAVKKIGVPRKDWWFWTEQGWTALLALQGSSIFHSDAGAIFYNCSDSMCKSTGVAEIMRMWFLMVEEIRVSWKKAGFPDEELNRVLYPIGRNKIYSSIFRFAGCEDNFKRGELRAWISNVCQDNWKMRLVLVVASGLRKMSLGFCMRFLRRLFSFLKRKCAKKNMAKGGVIGEKAIQTEKFLGHFNREMGVL